MRHSFIVMVSVLLITGCIGWNGRQREVVDSYMDIRSASRESDWEQVHGCLTRGTRETIDELVSLFQESGAPLLDSRDGFFEALAMETGMFELSDVIHSVEFAGDRAILAADGADGPRTYEFLLEGGRWKLNLSGELEALFAMLMQGAPSGMPEGMPSYISSGEGPCQLLIRNGLTGVAIHGVYCTLSTDDSWGEDHLGPSILGTGSELGLNLEAGLYDVQVYDSMERSYTLWQVELDQNGVFWEVTEGDLDQL